MHTYIYIYIGLKIGTIDDLKKVHIQTYPLGQSVRRLCYHAAAGVFAGTYIYIYRTIYTALHICNTICKIIIITVY